MHRRDVDRIAVECLQALERMGVTVEIISDYARLPEILEQLEGGVGLANDPQRLLLTSGNSFWVAAYEKGVPIAAFGVRVDDLGDDDAQVFLPKSIEVIFGVKITGALSDIYSGQRWRRAAYFGGLVSRNARGLSSRGGKMLRLLTAYVHHCSFTDLGADVNYCFLRKQEGGRGLSYGFLEPGPFVWTTERPMYKDGNPEWVMKLSVQDLPKLMTAMSVLMRDGIAEDQQPGRIVQIKNATGC